MPHTGYNHDVVLWAREQAALLRAGRLAELDIANIAEEIEDVGKAEQRELASRMAVLLMHLLKWAFQPGKRTRSWLLTIKEQRRGVLLALQDTPSLKTMLANPTKRAIAVQLQAQTVSGTSLSPMDLGQSNSVRVPPGESRNVAVFFTTSRRKGGAVRICVSPHLRGDDKVYVDDLRLVDCNL